MPFPMIPIDPCVPGTELESEGFLDVFLIRLLLHSPLSLNPILAHPEKVIPPHVCSSLLLQLLSSPDHFIGERPHRGTHQGHGIIQAIVLDLAPTGSARSGGRERKRKGRMAKHVAVGCCFWPGVAKMMIGDDSSCVEPAELEKRKQTKL